MNICSQEQKSNTSDFCDRWSEDEPLGTTCIKAIDLVSRVDARIDSKSLIINTFPSFFQGVGDLREEYEIRFSQEQQLTLSSHLDMCHYHFDLRFKKSLTEWNP